MVKNIFEIIRKYASIFAASVLFYPAILALLFGWDYISGSNFGKNTIISGFTYALGEINDVIILRVSKDNNLIYYSGHGSKENNVNDKSNISYSVEKNQSVLMIFLKT